MLRIDGLGNPGIISSKSPARKGLVVWRAGWQQGSSSLHPTPTIPIMKMSSIFRVCFFVREGVAGSVIRLVFESAASSARNLIGYDREALDGLVRELPFSSTGIFPFSWKQMFPESQSKYRPPLPGASLFEAEPHVCAPAPPPTPLREKRGLPDNEAGAYT
ncbi:hypothetical protein CDAR_309801 [Caerostris darwini]|uniref:Uncharacterized protein n=1 Tax=Caerostris darwini TaxID=1538125 RepID=A0AAV4VZQ3_9ARAC|nr:hypothetical protein CDAR_309801 [Caerostris darwini]